MLIYLINTSRSTNTIHLPIGIGCIAKSLSSNGFKVKIIDLVPYPEKLREAKFKEFLSTVKEPACFGLSIIAGNNQIVIVEKFTNLIKENNSDNIVIYGGPLPSSVPELCLYNTKADYIITGEGEETIIDLLNNIGKDLSIINNLAYRNNEGQIIVNRKKRISNIDRYYPIPYEMYNMDFYVDYLKETNRCFEISGSRGCKGACTFCYRFSGPGLTTRSADSIFNEIRYVYETFKIDRFNFTDENFLEEKKVFYKLLDLLKDDNIKIKFRGQTRVDEITEDFCSSLVKHGLIGINFGLESADNSILAKISKGITIEDIEQKINIMKKFGVEVYVSVIVGFPWETDDSIAALKNFIIRNNLQGYCSVNFLAPLPATTIYRNAVKDGLINDEWEYILNIGDLYRDTSINLTEMPDEKIIHYFNEIYDLGANEIPTASTKYTNMLNKRTSALDYKK